MRQTIMSAAIHLPILIAAFVGIVIWVSSRKRKARFEKDANIAFNDNRN
jgi:cbb3-type cytochrome oxidase subunit 3